MIPSHIKKILDNDRKLLEPLAGAACAMPAYSPETHYLELTKSSYYFVLLRLRHYIKLASDYYFSQIVNATNVDLFMLTPSVSSPMGPGSDSEAIPISFGGVNSYLVDSSQFGFEPLVMNGMDRVYCYLPSMRGENFDKRHLNQFFHCEMEMSGTLDDMRPIIEGYVKFLAELLLESKATELIACDYEATKKALKAVLDSKGFGSLDFSEAVGILENGGFKDLVNYTKNGRDISYAGEAELMRIMEAEKPLWLLSFDRDRVPFYQKPNSVNPDQVINADLLFPSVVNGSFQGEIIGCGQRQDNAEEMYESLKRQGLDPGPYEWYINLRRQRGYRVTSGFGMGIERFIAWSLGFDDIKNAIIYPRLKGVLTYP